MPVVNRKPRKRLKTPAISPITTKTVRRVLDETKPKVVRAAMIEFEMTRPTTKATSSTDPATLVVAPAVAARSSAWEPVSAPMPWIMPMPSAVFQP